jgi:hypothetical protein
MYAGSRWAKGCHPNEFMQPHGYGTSSKVINQIIIQEGVDSFEILRIDTNLDGLSAYEYETLFLQTVNCANSHDWYNGHNNTGIAPALGTEWFKNTMKLKYGVEYTMQMPDFKNKQQRSNKNTLLERYGVVNTSQIQEVKDKKIDTNMKRSGFENPSQDPEIKARSEITRKATMMETYGVDNPNFVMFLSIVATKKSYAKNILSRCYPEFKIYY